MTKINLLQGTLDMLILRVLARGEMHGWGIVDRLSQLSKNTLKLGEGSVYPSLYRMENKGWVKAEWRITENNRWAKYYRLTAAGKRQLATESETWDVFADAMTKIMRAAAQPA